MPEPNRKVWVQDVNIASKGEIKMKKKNQNGKHPQIEIEWNYEKNGSLSIASIPIGTTLKVWWKNDEEHEKDSSIKNGVNDEKVKND